METQIILYCSTTIFLLGSLLCGVAPVSFIRNSPARRSERLTIGSVLRFPLYIQSYFRRWCWRYRQLGMANYIGTGRGKKPSKMVSSIERHLERFCRRGTFARWTFQRYVAPLNPMILIRHSHFGFYRRERHGSETQLEMGL